MSVFENSLQFTAGGRELLTEARVEELTKEWTSLEPTYLRLSNKSFDLPSMQKVVEYLNKISPTLQIADISDIIAGRPEEEALKALRALSEGLKRFELLDINLSDNALGQKGIEACRDILERKNMTKLYLCNDGLSAEAVGLLSEILLKDSVPLLTLLHFYNNMSGDEGAKNMSTILTACPTIEDLRFSATRSGNAGCLKIAEAIGTITSLTKLDLMDNTFGTVAADKLGHSLLRHTKLQHLNLRDDMLGDAGLIKMMNTLGNQTFPQLTHLDLSGNEISEKSMKVIAKWIGHHLPALEYLAFDDNELESDGLLQLVPVLLKLPSLKRLSLNTCEITARGAMPLMEKLISLPQFEHLEINGNAICETSINAIKEMFEINKKTLGELDENDDEADDDFEEYDDKDEEDDDEDEEKADKEDEDDAADELTEGLKKVSI